MTSSFRFVYMVAVVLLTSITGKAETIEFFNQSDPDSEIRIDHSAWDRLLKAYIRTDSEGLNRFDYDGVTEEDKAALEAYLERLQAVDVTELNKAEQHAFWINAYNAVTVNVVLDEWPLESIRDIDKLLFIRTFGPWKRELFTVEDQILSLDSIEHKILRPIWQDPRTHYAVNCASIGCPNLQDQAFTAEDLDTLLDKGARDFINSPRGIQRFQPTKIEVSSIYSWFKEDFGTSDEAIIAHMKRYASDDTRAKLADVTRISGHDYDWNINKVVK